MCVHQDKSWSDNPHLIYMIEGQGKPESCWTGFGEHIGGERLHPLTPPRSRCPHHSLSPHSLSLTLRAGEREWTFGTRPVAVGTLATTPRTYPQEAAQIRNPRTTFTTPLRDVLITLCQSKSPTHPLLSTCTWC